MKSETKHQNGYGQLFIVATPIGNLADISYRAVETLKTVDTIAAEDTRTSRKLLQHYGIETPMIALHEHNESSMTSSLLGRIQNGENIALISDAGTPLISDPGYRLVQHFRSEGMTVTPIPGASSIITALCASGLPTDHFRYAGFLSRSGQQRRSELAAIADCPETTVVLESPRRLLATLRNLADLIDEQRQLVVARELTKLHEEFVCGSIDKLIARFEATAPRGEIVLLIGGAVKKQLEVNDQMILDQLANASMQEMAPSARAKAVATALAVPKSRVYALLIDPNS